MSVNAKSEWDYLPQGDKTVVTHLIKNRSRQDPAYYPSLTSVDCDSTSGTFVLSEAIICTYVDLERLIDNSGLSKNELMTVQLLMRGYSIQDISFRFEKTRQTFEVIFKRAVEKICKANDLLWVRVYKKS